MLRALVTGANGFLGSRLVTRLRGTGVEVYALVRRSRGVIDEILPPSRVATYEGTGDCMARLLGDLRPDTIFHVATTMCSDVGRVLQTNIMLGTQILHALQELGHLCAFVNAGSFSEFATDHECWERELYSATKRDFHNIVTLYRRSAAIRAVTLTLYDIYGPYDRRGKLWQQLLETQPGDSLPLTHGHQLIDLVYVDDVVEAFLVAARQLHAGTALQERYAVDSVARAPLREVTGRFLNALEKNVRLEWDAIRHPGIIMTPWTGPRLPGWSPQILLETGVRCILKTESLRRSHE